MIFTGHSQGTVKDLKDPEAKRGVGLDPASLKSVSEDEGKGIPTPRDDRTGALHLPLQIKGPL
jgi:hypothetical protein